MRDRRHRGRRGAQIEAAQLEAASPSTAGIAEAVLMKPFEIGLAEVKAALSEREQVPEG
jgi:hypothetical protein